MHRKRVNNLKLTRMALLMTLAALVLLLASCGSGWGEEVVYVRIDNGTNAMDWIVTADGELMKPVADYGMEEFDFSSCRTGDVLRLEIYLIQEIFPANAVYKRCEPTGKTADVVMKDEYKAWLTETPDSVWTIVE